MKQSIIKRFVTHVNVKEHGDCWEWLGGAGTHGYGVFNMYPKFSVLAHRFAYYLITGEYPNDWCVCHHCDNKSCVNPGHLFLGTHADNMRDMIQKGRATKARGQRNGRALLTPEEVLEIRNSSATYKILSKRYGVSVGAISEILAGVNWAHIGGPRQRRHLTEDQVTQIRRLHQGGNTGKSIAGQFSVSEGLISGIVNRKVWANVT